MAKYNGSAMLIKVGDGATVEAFTTIAATTNVTFSGSNGLVEVTDKDNSGYREILSGAGLKSFTLNLDGFVNDSATLDSLRTAFINKTAGNYQFVDGEGTWEGAFYITQFNESGGVEDGQTFSATFENNGTVSFT